MFKKFIEAISLWPILSIVAVFIIALNIKEIFIKRGNLKENMKNIRQAFLCFFIPILIIINDRRRDKSGHELQSGTV